MDHSLERPRKPHGPIGFSIWLLEQPITPQGLLVSGLLALSAAAALFLAAIVTSGPCECRINPGVFRAIQERGLREMRERAELEATPPAATSPEQPETDQ